MSDHEMCVSQRRKAIYPNIIHHAHMVIRFTVHKQKDRAAMILTSLTAMS